MRISLALLLVAAGLAVSAAPAGAAAPKDLVKAQLLSEVGSIKPGQPFTVGVLMKMKPHWHVYWKNPGDAGMAPSVEWKLPEGFTAGELRFPIPTLFEQPGPVIGYGYEDEVLLTATINPPQDVTPGKPLEIAADVNWLVCEDVCIPGKATLKLTLPVGEAEKSAEAELFAKWRQRLPQRIELATNIKGTGTEQSPEGPTAFVVWSQKPKDVQWFAVPPDGSGLENIQTRHDGDVSKMTFSLAPAPKGAAEMQFVVAFTDTNGKRQGVEFGVKLPPVAKQ